jgi:hypothetical protein
MFYNSETDMASEKMVDKMASTIAQNSNVLDKCRSTNWSELDEFGFDFRSKNCIIKLYYEKYQVLDRPSCSCKPKWDLRCRCGPINCETIDGSAGEYPEICSLQFRKCPLFHEIMVEWIKNTYFWYQQAEKDDWDFLEEFVVSSALDESKAREDMATIIALYKASGRYSLKN